MLLVARTLCGLTSKYAHYSVVFSTIFSYTRFMPRAKKTITSVRGKFYKSKYTEGKQDYIFLREKLYKSMYTGSKIEHIFTARKAAYTHFEYTMIFHENIIYLISSALRSGNLIEQNCKHCGRTACDSLVTNVPLFLKDALVLE